MSTQQYAINKLVMLSKRQQEAADFVAHCGTAEASRDLALAHLRHVFGQPLVSLNEATGAIVVKGLFTATPVQSRSPFQMTGSASHFL